MYSVCRKKIVMLFLSSLFTFWIRYRHEILALYGPQNDKISGINFVIRKNLCMTLTFCPIEYEPFGPVCKAQHWFRINWCWFIPSFDGFFRLFWQIYRNSVHLVIEWSSKVYSLIWRVFYTLQNGNRKKLVTILIKMEHFS